VARLPSERYLIQQIGGEVILFEEGTEREVIRVPLVQDDGVTLNGDGIAQAQKVIHDSELSDEDKSMAHFWCGYFWAHAAG
jgi:hypothetical protein